MASDTRSSEMDFIKNLIPLF